MVKPQICLFCLVIIILFSIPTAISVYPVKESTTSFGSLMIDNDLFSIIEDQYSILQISGTAVNTTTGVRVVLVVDKPDGSTIELKTIPNSDGEFSTSLALDANWEKGDYAIHAFYNENQIGTVNFSISDVQAPTIITSSNIGSINVEDENYTVTTNGTAIIEIYGKVIDYDENEPILFSLKKPDGVLESFSANGKRTGEYITRLTAKDDWQTGKYYVMATYKGKELGEISFTLDKTNLASQSGQIIQIPKWVKTNAEWWSANQITDSEFVKGIQYLIKEGILVIPETTSDSTSSGTQEIPSWLRKNAGWWSQGFISDDEFVKAIQYLIQKNIINVF